MAQTKRKRRTKHRGNAAGTIEVRGRTGRPPTAEEKKQKEKLDRARAREARLNKPPTWKAAFNRAVFASLLMFIFLLIFAKGNIAAAIIFAAVAMVLYVPGGYYMDSWQYRRRMKRQQQVGRK